jgi:hypothetical protein
LVAVLITVLFSADLRDRRSTGGAACISIARACARCAATKRRSPGC